MVQRLSRLLPFRNLPRNKDAWSRESSKLTTKRKLEAKIDRHSYRMCFVPNTEEVLVRRWSKEQLGKAQERAGALAKERESCVAKFVKNDGVV